MNITDLLVALDYRPDPESAAAAETIRDLLKQTEVVHKSCETCEDHTPNTPNLIEIWKAADKKAKDWRTAGEKNLLQQMQDGLNGLKSLGWRDGKYAPKDGTQFLSIEAGSTGVCLCYWMDNDRMKEGGGFWAEAHGDLWPAKPTLWKPLQFAPTQMSKPELINDLRALCTHMLDVACKLDAYGGTDALAKGHAVELHGAACIVHEWIENLEDDGK